MKKKFKIFLFILCFLLPIKVLGACTVDDKIRYLSLASNVTTSYDYVENDDKVNFSITIHNVHKELVVKDNINNKSYGSNKNNLNNYTISNLAGGINYSFSIYAKSGDCSYKLLNTIYVNLPKYNKYYKDPVCNGIDNYGLCQRWGEIGDIDYETFKLKVEEYKKTETIIENEKENEKSSSIIEIISDFWAKYYLYITLGTIITLLPIIIFVNKKNKYDF